MSPEETWNTNTPTVLSSWGSVMAVDDSGSPAASPTSANGWPTPTPTT